jgi:hypothetical protein
MKAILGGTYVVTGGSMKQISQAMLLTSTVTLAVSLNNLNKGGGRT